MSNIFGAPRAVEEARTVPSGETVGSYNSYLDAQKAVDYLADQQFPVQMVSIVGNELKMVERVTGRLSYPRVALSAALSGMWFGLFVGVMLSFFSPTGGYFSIVTSVLMGAAFFMLFGIVTYAMQRGKRDFTSTSQVVATNYDVIVAVEAAHEARRLLHQLPMKPSDAAGVRPVNYTQRDYYNQPFQQPGQGDAPQGQAPQGQTPQRPASWSDPYGQRPADAGQPNPGQPNPGQPNPGQPNAGQPNAGQPNAGQPEQGAPAPHQGAHAYGQPGGEQQPTGAEQAAAAEEAAAAERARASRLRYPDLPDGRPQYGVRVTDPEKQQPGGPQQ